MKKFVIRGALGLLAVLFALVIFEIFLRFFTPEPENLAKIRSSGNLLYENKPNASFDYGFNGSNINTVSFNSFGFHDKEFFIEKAPDVTRIVVLGDSYEEGLQLPKDKIWQNVMEKTLKDSGKNVEVYNFGVSGYGTDQEWIILKEKVWQFKPDIVIVAFTGNDVGDVYKNNLVKLKDDKLVLVSEGERAGGNILGKFLRETYLYHFAFKVSALGEFTKRAFGKFRTAVLGFKPEDRFFLSDAQLIQGPFEVIASQKNPPAEVTSSWKVIGALLADMKKQADEHGAKFLVTVNVSKGRLDEDIWRELQTQYKLDAVNSTAGEIFEVLKGLTNQGGIAYYDPYSEAVIWQRDRSALYWELDGHYNENGAVFMGTTLAAYLLQNNFLEKKLLLFPLSKIVALLTGPIEQIY